MKNQLMHVFDFATAAADTGGAVLYTRHAAPGAPPLYLVGLTGKPGAGKDTVAAYLARHGYRAIAFADALRAELAEAWRTDPRIFGARETKEWPILALSIGMCCDPAFVVWCRAQGHDLNDPRSPRWLMQTWGEWRCAEVGPLYWVVHVSRLIGQWTGIGHRHICLTDVRKPIELQHLVANGGKLLRVVRPDHSTLLSADTASHATEVQQRLLIAADEIHNDGTLDHLPAEIERVVAKHWGAGALPNVYAGQACSTEAAAR